MWTSDGQAEGPLHNVVLGAKQALPTELKQKRKPVNPAGSVGTP